MTGGRKTQPHIRHRGASPGGGAPAAWKSSPCDELRFETTLNSPNRVVLSKIRVGEILSIQLKEETLIVVSAHGVAGSITSDRMLQLRECILTGHEYIGRVTQLAQGMCRVEISASGQ